MHSYQSLSGTESSSFWQYWDLIRNNLWSLRDVGPKIKALWQEAKNEKARTSDPQVRAKLEDQIYRLSDMYVTWQNVEEYLNEWSDEWSMIAASDSSQSAPAGAMSLGFLPFVLPAWAIGTLAAGGLAALTYVATHGLDLLKQYQSEQAILSELRSGNANVDALIDMYGSIQSQPGGFLDTFGSTMGSSMGSMIPIMVGICALLFFGPRLLNR